MVENEPILTEEQELEQTESVSNQESNRESVNNDITEGYVCPECGWTPRADSKDPEKSLKGHMMRTHKIPWAGKRKRESPQRIDVSPYAETIKDEVFDTKTDVQLLAVKKRKLELERQVESLEERKSMLEGERREREQGRGGFRDREAYRQNRFWKNEDEREEEVSEWKVRKLKAEIQALEGGGESQVYEDPRIETLTDEVKELRTKLDDEREKRREDQMKALTAEVKELKETTKVGSTQTDAIIEAVHGVERVIVALAGGSVQPPKRERIGKPDIISLVPEGMVE